MKPEVLETVMTEILEEQKQVSDKLGSYTSILMEVNDKLSKTEEADFNNLNERLRLIQMACQSIHEQFSFPVKEITQLKISLDSCTMQLRQPLQQQIKHQISKIWMVAIALLIALIVIIYFLLDANGRLQQYRSNDYKYRHLKLTNNKSIQQLLMYADSLYIINPDSFKTSVRLRELQKQRKFELLEQATNKELEAKKLRKQAGEKQKP
jgi:hypothetical protein